MEPPSFLESHVSQIPAIQMLRQLGYSYLGQGDEASIFLNINRLQGEESSTHLNSILQRIGGSNPPLSHLSFRLVIKTVFHFLVFNRPSTPLYDAQLGGYFFARITQAGSTAV